MRPASCLLRSIKPLERNPATASVLEAALAHTRSLVHSIGPCTTHTLYTALHHPSSPPLPRQAPRNVPPVKDPVLRRQRARPASSTPTADDPAAAAAQWSMAFLKRRVLAPLLADGALVKLTRERWERTTGSPLPPQEKGEEGESAFVWIDSRRWDALARRESEGRALPPREVGVAPRRPAKGDVERELKRLRREEGSSAPWSE